GRRVAGGRARLRPHPPGDAVARARLHGGDAGGAGAAAGRRPGPAGRGGAAARQRPQRRPTAGGEAHGAGSAPAIGHTGGSRGHGAMTATVFQSGGLSAQLWEGLRDRLRGAHAEQPFSTGDPRTTVRRVAAIAGDLGLQTTVYRGGVDLRGSEVDHVWLGVEPPGEHGDRGAYVVDAAFPLFSVPFVEMLRRFVAGEVPAAALEVAAAEGDVEQRVIGTFPPPVRYRGQPVWSSRFAAGR